MGVSAVWICLHWQMVVGTTPAERGEWKRAGPLLYGVSLHQHPQTSPGIFQTGPSILPTPKGRVHSTNLCQMPCKKCEQVQGVQRRKKIVLIQPETGRTHHYSRANCILDMCTHDLCTQRGTQVCLHSRATWLKSALCRWHLDTFLKCSVVLLGVLLGLSLISFVYQN